MKIAFYKAVRPGLQGVYSRAVRFVDRGPYSHCELIFSDGVSASSSYTDGGVRFKQIDYDDTHWDTFDLPDHLEQQAREWFNGNVGRPYDLPGNLHFLLFFIKDCPYGWFCSEAIAAALGLEDAYRFGPNGLAALVRSKVFHGLDPV